MTALGYEKVEKHFGEVTAVDSVDLEIPEGEIFGLLGPNGAGKTTLIRMTMGILLPDSGVIRVFGEPFTRRSTASFGYLPEERGLYPKMKVGELLTFFARVRGLAKKEAEKKVGAGLARMGMEEWRDKRTEALSKGMQQKIQFLISMIHEPKIAILDEPFSGLDPVNAQLFKEMILETKEKGTTIVLSTHQMEQVEQLCDKIALINRGRIVLKGAVDEVRRSYGARELSVEFAGEARESAKIKPLAETVSLEGRRGLFRMKEGVKARDVALALLEEGMDITKFEESQASMHDIFVQVVKSGKGGENGD